MSRLIEKIRRDSAPIVAQVFRRLIQSGAFSPTSKLRLWHLAERYISFYGVNAVVSIRDNPIMAVNTSKMVEKQIFFFGEWEPFLTRYIRDAQNQGGIFLDVGANIGYFTWVAAQIYDRVIAIEASPSISVRLAENVRRNGLHNVEIRNIAVGEEIGEADFFYDERHSGHSSLIPGKRLQFEAKVPISPLDKILETDEINKISFIKLDIEGFEHVALR